MAGYLSGGRDERAIVLHAASVPVRASGGGYGGVVGGLGGAVDLLQGIFARLMTPMGLVAVALAAWVFWKKRPTQASRNGRFGKPMYDRPADPVRVMVTVESPDDSTKPKIVTFRGRSVKSIKRAAKKRYPGMVLQFGRSF